MRYPNGYGSLAREGLALDRQHSSGLQAAGDSEFLDGLYRQHIGELRAYLRRKFGLGPPEPDDLAQAAFARFAALNNKRDIPNPKAYLLLTARNLAIDAHRMTGTSQRLVANLAILDENHADPSSEDVVSSREELKHLAEIVATLKPKQRAAFLLNRVDGLSFAEVARQLNISESGARALVNRALEICVRGLRK